MNQQAEEYQIDYHQHVGLYIMGREERELEKKTIELKSKISILRKVVDSCTEYAPIHDEDGGDVVIINSVLGIASDDLKSTRRELKELYE